MAMVTWSEEMEKRVMGLEERVEVLEQAGGRLEATISLASQDLVRESNGSMEGLTSVLRVLRKTLKEVGDERDFFKRENEELRLQNADLCVRWVKASGNPINPDEMDMRQFVQSFNAVAVGAFKGAIDHGFWGEVRNQGEVIALMHSELSEALDAIRHGNPPDGHIPDFSGTEAELADCIIRIMDAAAGFNWRVAEAVVAKLEYNRSRPFKHGKEF